MLVRMENLRRIRKQLFRVSQVEFAEIAGVTQATVSRWESGILAPGLVELDRIRAAAKSRRLKLRAEEFFSEAPEEGAAA